jgi:Fuc2NAc and GlcNAc transferase
MTPVALAALTVVTFAASWLITGRLRRYAISQSLIDHPNSRSSHQSPTPRGGGLAIVLAFISALAVLALAGAVDAALFVGLAGAASMVAAIGFIDDHGHVPARWRLAAHFGSAIWLLAWAGGTAGLEVLQRSGVPLPLGFALATVLTVWLINLYNFMDGIDGVASVEAITTSIGGAALCLLAGGGGVAVAALALAAATAGFLMWNWSPAKIFMGDVGSGAIGVSLAGLALFAARENSSFVFAWAILLGVFIVDSGLTLLRRLLRREKIYEAHRMHAYQHAARHFESHATVSLAVAAINLFWLLPMALLVAQGVVPRPLGLCLAYAPLIALAMLWHAGVPEPERSQL